MAAALGVEFERTGCEVIAPSKAECDVTSPESVRDCMEAHFPVHVLVNNAGLIRDSLAAGMTEEDWDAVLAVNLKGAFLCARHAARRMAKQRDGHVVNIGSFSGLTGGFGQANYAAAKAGLIGLTQSLARELGPRNVRANCVLPGYLETKFTANVPEEAKQAALDRHVLGRFNTVVDAARFIVHLDSLPAVSGQVFQLDSRIRSWG